jgi:hypothetical protein
MPARFSPLPSAQAFPPFVQATLLPLPLHVLHDHFCPTRLGLSPSLHISQGCTPPSLPPPLTPRHATPTPQCLSLWSAGQGHRRVSQSPPCPTCLGSLHLGCNPSLSHAQYEDSCAGLVHACMHASWGKYVNTFLCFSVVPSWGTRLLASL